MALRPKLFRIETISQPLAAVNGHGRSGAGTAEILAEIRALKAVVQPPQHVISEALETYRREIAEAQKLKVELDSIWEAINQTKQEIATLHHTGFQGEEMVRVTGELDAIVGGTENATNIILSAAERIDQDATTLAARLTKSPQDHDLATEIGEQVVQIFEACNFQDLTGQRITKVVNTLKFIEDRIMRMMEIWGGLDSFNGIEPEEMAKAEGDEALLNGPGLDGDTGRASQDDIDALFA